MGSVAQADPSGDDSGIVTNTVTTTYKVYDTSQETFDAGGNLVVPPSALVSTKTVDSTGVNFVGTTTDAQTYLNGGDPVGPSDLLTQLVSGAAAAYQGAKADAQGIANWGSNFTAGLLPIVLVAGGVVALWYLSPIIKPLIARVGKAVS